MQANARATGIALGMIAILMGGSKAEAITNQPRAISAGLDYFCLELLVLAMVFVPMERIWSLHDQKIFRNGWQTDLKHFFASHAGVQLLSFIDAIFGTAHMPPYWPKRYGTTKFQPPETYLGQLAYPFRKHEETPYG